MAAEQTSRIYIPLVNMNTEPNQGASSPASSTSDSPEKKKRRVQPYQTPLSDVKERTHRLLHDMNVLQQDWKLRCDNAKRALADKDYALPFVASVEEQSREFIKSRKGE